MLNLKIGKHKCTIPNEWNELNVSQYARIVKILTDYEIKSIDEIEDETQKAKQKMQNIKANRDVFSFLTGLDMKVIEKCDLNEMNECLSVMNEFLNTRIEHKIKEEDEQHFFDWKGKRYFFPHALMKKTTFGDYIEAEHVMSNAKAMEEGGSRFALIAEQMAILCKEEGEETNDDLIRKKTRLFEKLPMDIVWKFVFFLMKQTNTFPKNIQTSSKMDTDHQIDMQTKTGTS